MLLIEQQLVQLSRVHSMECNVLGTDANWVDNEKDNRDTTLALKTKEKVIDVTTMEINFHCWSLTNSTMTMLMMNPEVKNRRPSSSRLNHWERSIHSYFRRNKKFVTATSTDYQSSKEERRTNSNAFFSSSFSNRNKKTNFRAKGENVYMKILRRMKRITIEIKRRKILI